MALDPDPYRTLGLARGASLTEVKKAYRRLAKEHHPDAAGEAALPRFLAIQTAYDQIVGGASSRSDAARATPRKPWDADPTRADATRRAYGARARRERPAGAARDGARRGPAAGAGGPAAGAGGPAEGADGSAADGGPTAAGGRRTRPPNKATLGSTSYDGAEAEPFEPDWGGASWYGTTSGTYWTLNPKEYADPRKHGPEYQARARRAAEAERGGWQASADTVDPDDASSMDGPSPDEAPSAPGDPASGNGPAPGSEAPPTHTTSSWWDATAASAAPDVATAGPAAAAGGPSAAWTWLEGDRTGPVARVGRAVLAWIPLAVAIGAVGRELSGCTRFAPECQPAAGTISWLVAVALLIGLIALPRVAAVLATAAVVSIAVAVPVVLFLAVPGTSSPVVGDVPILSVAVIAAWLAGLLVGASRALGRRSRPVS